MDIYALCSVCHQEAKVSCYCSGLATLLCSNCYLIHAQNKPGFLHLANPIEPSHHSKRVPDEPMCFCGNSTQKSCRFCRLSIGDKRRKLGDDPVVNDGEMHNAVKAITEEMRKNLAKLAEFKACLSVTRSNFLLKIEEVFARAMEKIEVLELTINQIQEDISLASDSNALDESIYAHWLIKDFISSQGIDRGSDLSLFSWEINQSQVINSLDSFCTLDVNSLPSPSLCYFKPGSNTCFTYSISSSTMAKTLIRTSDQFRNGAVWCQLADQKYFYCGGELRGVSNQAALIYTKEGSLHPMPSMNATRAYHGIIYLNRAVYVFGGHSPSGRLKSCEKYDFERSQWMYLPSMTEARSHFTPCTSQAKIYIVGGCGASLIECFDPVEMCFTKINVTLPFQNYWTMTAFHNNELIIFQGNTVLTVNLTSLQSSRFHVQNSGGWWSETPVYTFKDTMLFFKKKSVIAFEYKVNCIKETAVFN